jgi:protein phosphatase
VQLECSNENGWIIAVADGLGGQHGGGRASAEVVDALSEYHVVSPPGLSALLAELHNRFVNLGTSEPKYAGLGATVAGLAFGTEGLFAFNVGDARVYQQQDRFLAQITEDDSIAQLLVREGQLEEQNAREYSSHRLTQAIGGRLEFKPIQPHSYPLNLRQTTRFLICSDGLCDALSLDQMEHLLASNSETNEAVQSLFDAACKAECKDNISVIVVDISVISAAATNNTSIK